MSKNSKKAQTGQALLIVVLIMVVGLTVGLSLAARSITNLRITTEEENSQRAFSAAEAGIERVLKTGSGISGVQLGNNATIENATILSSSSTEFLFNGGNPVPQDIGADLWLSDYSDNPSAIYLNPYPLGGGTRNIRFYWGISSIRCAVPALEIIIISGNLSTPLATRYAYDVCGGRRGQNNFSSGVDIGGTVLGTTFFFRTQDIPITRGRIAKVIPLYGDTKIAVTVGGPPPLPSLPPQGKMIESTGVSGDTTRKISVFQGFPSIPTELFAYVLFSP